MSAQRHTACYQVIARLVKTSYFNDILYTLNSGSENTEFLISFGLSQSYWLNQQTHNLMLAQSMLKITFFIFFFLLILKAKYVPFLQLHISRNNSTKRELHFLFLYPKVKKKIDFSFLFKKDDNFYFIGKWAR